MQERSRAVHLCEQVALRLGLDDPGAAWRDDLQRVHLPEDSAAALAEAVLESGRRCGVAFLRQSYAHDEFAPALRGAPAPLVLVAEHPDHGVRGALVEQVDAAGLTLRLAEGGGLGERTTLSFDDALVRLAGAQGVIGVLFPARVLPEAVLGATSDARVRSPVDRLGELLLLEKGNIGLVYAYATLTGLFSLTLPLGVQAIIGLVSGGLFLQPIVILIALVVLGTAVTGVLQVLQLAAVERIQQRLFARIALEFSLHVPRVNLEQNLKGDLPERMNRFFEVITIQKSLGKLLTGASTALLQVIFGLLLLTFYHPYFTLFGLGLVAVLALIVRITGPRGLETSLMESKYKYRAVHWLEEVARTVSAFKAAGRATPALDRMDAHVSGYLRYRQRHFRVLVIQAMAAVGFKTLVTGALLILGSVLVIQRQITLGQFVAAELVIVTVLAGIERVVGSLAEVYDLLTAVYKLGGVTDLRVERMGGLGVESSENGVAVRLEDVGYTYPSSSRPALQGITLRAAPGERIAITGADGSGASTLLAVLSGMLPGYTGTVQIDGITMHDLDPASLRARVGMMSNINELFEGTVEENISLGRAGIGSAEVMRALARVGAAEAVQDLPLGLRTPIASAGRGVPSTLRVRLLVARAIVGAPRLVLLDETLATVEPLARQELLAVLTGPEAPWTLFFVTHATEVLAACDRVLVLRDGDMQAFGTWNEVAADPLVRELFPAAAETA
jgi:ABC-type bacteriocin/lantibiotic exporter with double-glycine peptidase domain